MAFQWMRRVLLALAPAALLALAGCGSGTIESQFKPTRVVAFGDGLTDMGNTATGTRFTVNDTRSQWVKLVAGDYGLGLDKSSAGSTDYATGNARVLLEPDAAGGTATATIKEQIDAFLAANGTFNDNDLVVIQGGISDIIVQMQAYRAGTITSDQLVQNARQAGSDFAAQARRLVAAGATHVAVLGVYDLGKTPWAAAIDQKTLLTSASTAYNTGVLVDLVDQGDKMLYIDIALLFNLMVNNPASYSFTDVVTPVCTVRDPGPGIGIGTNEINSALCTPENVITGANYLAYLWADAVYPATMGQSRIADTVFTRVHNRW